MDKKIIFSLIFLITLTFFVNGILASNIISGTYSVGSYSLGLSSSSSLAFNAIYNASAGFSPTTTNFAKGIAGGVIFTPTSPAASVVVSNLPLPQGNTAPQTSQQYLWALVLNPQITSVLNFSNPVFGFNSSLSLNEMDITTNTAQNANLVITQFYNEPAGISYVHGQVYQYVKIELNTPLNSGNANLIFKINKTWISQNNIDPNNITICKLDNLTNNSWRNLQTIYYGSDNNFDYYQANVSSFSYFAIFGNVLASAPIQQPATTSNSIQPQKSTSPSKNQNLIWLFILLAFIIITIICTIISKKRKIRRIINGEIDKDKSAIRKLKRIRNRDERGIRNFFSSLKRKERKLFKKF